MCYVILSGFRLWVKRRADDRQWRAFGRVVQVFGYGLPIAMLVSAYGFFLSRPAGDAFWWTPASFLVGAVAAVLVALAVPGEERLGLAYQRLLGLACLGLPVLRLAMGGMDWAEAVLMRPARRADGGHALPHRGPLALALRPGVAAGGDGGCRKRRSERDGHAGRGRGEPRRDRIPCGHRPEAAAGVPPAGGRGAPGAAAWALVLLPGVLVPLCERGAGFVVWLGATATLGWLLVGMAPKASWKRSASGWGDGGVRPRDVRR